MLTTSVAVVRKMLEAVAGSAPSFLRMSGIEAPEMPLAAQETIIAAKTQKPSMTGAPLPWLRAKMYMPSPATRPTRRR